MMKILGIWVAFKREKDLNMWLRVLLPTEANGVAAWLDGWTEAKEIHDLSIPRIVRKIMEGASELGLGLVSMLFLFSSRLANSAC